MASAIPNRLLIIGTSGQLGRDLVAACRRRQIACIRAQRNPDPDCMAMDLAAEADFKTLLHAQRPSCVINAAAYTAVDAAENEPDLARRVNTIAPGRLAAACRQLGIPLVHFSTDYVFSGQQTHAYREHDACAPLNVYGQSKAQGEQRIREQAGSYYIFRSSWLYRPGHRNFVSTMLRLFTGGSAVRVVDDQHGCPTWTHYLAEAVIEFLQRGLRDPDCFAAGSGTYHLCAHGQSSWYAFAQAIAELAQPSPRTMPQAITSSEYGGAVPRPAYSVLDCGLAETRLGLRLPHWRQQLNEALPLFNDKPAQARA